jgi:hypothetical protein
VIDGFCELRIGFAAHCSIVLKLLKVQIVRLQQLVSGAVEGVASSNS